MTMNTNGSTLLELIVVLVVIALLFGVAVPAMTATPGRAPEAAADSLRWAAIVSGAIESNDSLVVLPDGRSLERGAHDAQ